MPDHDVADAPCDLTDAALSLLRAPLLEEVSFAWQDEPGEWRWILYRTGDEVEIEILRFEETWSSLSNERGERLFLTKCSLLRFATQVKGQMHQMLNMWGEEGYAARWRCLFPMEIFRQLETQIQLRKKVTRSQDVSDGA